MARMVEPVWPRAGAHEAPPLLAHMADWSTLPDGRRCPFGWPAARVEPGAAVRMSWPAMARVSGPAILRVTVALDDREEKILEARSGATGVPLGRMEVR